MRKTFLISIAALCAVASQASVWTSGFETQDFSEWDGLATGESEVPTIDGSVFHSGSFSASVPGTNVDGGSGLNSYYKNIGALSADQTTVLTFWMKLGAASGNNRQYSELRSYSGDAFGTGSLDQLLAIGAYNGATNSIDGNGTVTTASNVNKWQARVALGGGYANGGWFVLDQAANRTLEWTRFDIVASSSSIGFYVDGTLGTAVELSRGGTWTADSVVLGSRLTSAGNSANFDDFEVDSVPEPATMVVLAGLGLAALRRRRSA